jgi:hypothetical protein
MVVEYCMENSFLIHFWKLKIIIMNAEFLFYFMYSNFELEKMDK